MNVVLFGATGMIGQGVLRECLLDPGVERVLSVARRATGVTHPKLEEVLHADFLDFTLVEDRLVGVDACFFCLGISSAGLSEAAYRRITRDTAVAAGHSLLRKSPQLTFVFVSGTGADPTEKGRVMWARVKGEAENALLAMPFKAVFVVRPAFVQPMHGATSSTAAYRWFYALTARLYPAVKAVAPRSVSTTENIGRAMLVLARKGADRRVLESHDIETLVAG